MSRDAPADACRCAVDGCRRWTQRERTGGHWLCCDHWGRLTRIEKAMLRRLWRTLRRIGWPHWWNDKRLRLRYLRTWRAAVRRAS